MPMEFPGQFSSRTPDISVTVSPIPFNSSNAQYAGGQAKSVWEDYVIENWYESDPHIYAMAKATPVIRQTSTQSSGPISTVAVVQLAAPTTIWICQWTAQRTNEKPKVPPQTSKNPNWVLLDAHVGTFQEEVTIDGETSVWRISGVYFYVHLFPATDVINNAEFGRPPWLRDFHPNERKASTQMYEDSISETPQQQGPSGGVTRG